MHGRCEIVRHALSRGSGAAAIVSIRTMQKHQCAIDHDGPRFFPYSSPTGPPPLKPAGRSGTSSIRRAIDHSIWDVFRRVVPSDGEGKAWTGEIER